MPDRDKVISQFVNYISRVGAYRKDCSKGCDACMALHETDGYCDMQTLDSVLVLLREQEPVEPKEEPYKIVCGNCGEKLAEICGDVDVVWSDDGKYPKFCPGCGRAVKWNA